jgi:hypothetical protein
MRKRQIVNSGKKADSRTSPKVSGGGRIFLRKYQIVLGGEKADLRKLQRAVFG